MERYLPPELAAGYEPLALLKEGAERQTLLLRERDTGAKLVLKRMLRPTEDAEEKYALLARLEGGVPKVRRYFQGEDAAYLLREYVEGETLLDLVQKHGPFPAKQTAQIGLALCRTLGALHSMQPPLIHRDIKAENVVRTPEGEYVLIDFDISRFYNDQDSRDTELRGSEFAAPPEQFGYRQTDPRSDIYALGVLLHELATGESQLEQGQTPASLRAVVNRCTRFDPKDRYQSAAALERALKGVCSGRRRPAAVLAVLGAVLAVWAVAAALGSQRGSGAGEPDLYEFHSQAIEAEVCRQLGKEPGTVTRQDLDQITHLFLCGDEHFDNWWEMNIHGADLRLNGVVGATGGTVDTLEDIRHLSSLQELALCNQKITDLSPLAGRWLLRLALHGNQVTDLSPLAECEHLLDLYISDNPVQDLSPLVRCRELCTLDAGATAVTDLDGAAAIPKLRYLSIMDCPDLTDTSALGSMTRLACLFIRPAGEEEIAAVGSLTGLEQLYLWSDDPAEDLTALSGLTGLTHLFVDMPVASLAGVETMTGLEYLDVRGVGPMDPSPLRGLTGLEQLNTAHLDQSALEDVLAGMPFLSRVGCAEGQADAVGRMLADRSGVEISQW